MFALYTRVIDKTKTSPRQIARYHSFKINNLWMLNEKPSTINYRF